MTAVTPAEFYQANLRKEKEYVRIFIAREIRAGEDALNSGVTVTARDNGYELRSGNGSYLGRRFMTKAAFAAKTISAENLALPVPKKNLAAEGFHDIVPIPEGETMIVHVDELTRAFETKAAYDGFVFKSASGKPMYMANYELTSRFNYAGQRCETRKEHVVALKDAPPVRGIVLEQKTTFLFKSAASGERRDTYPAGSFLYPDQNSEFGYSVEIMHPSPNMILRALTDYHAISMENQAKLNIHVPKVRLK